MIYKKIFVVGKKSMKLKTGCPKNGDQTLHNQIPRWEQIKNTQVNTCTILILNNRKISIFYFF